MVGAHLRSRYTSPVNHEIFGAIGEALTKGEEVALITITASNGSTPQRVGAKMLVYADGRTVGTIGGGCYEHDALGKARDALRTRKAMTAKYDLNDDFAEETGLVCGGQMEVFIEPLEAPPSLYVFGAGHVGFYLARAASDAGVEVSVRDTGAGIPEEDLPRIFERFYRVDKARSREAGGTGLGLAIVKHIVENAGGRVRVESVLSQGSTFLLTLPLAR